MVISNYLWKASRLSRRLWVRASLYGVVGISTALAAIVIGPWLPAGLPRSVGANAVDSILQIIASSMLAVTTFSLSTLVSATATAAGSATPRATRLLLEDPTAQRALSTFLGAFLFSLVSLIALNTDLYGDGGRFVLFIATLVVIALIVITLLRWMDHLAGLGNMGETISRVERSAKEAWRIYRADPTMGGVAPMVVAARPSPDDALPVFHTDIGYIQHIDVGHLNAVAEAQGLRIRVDRLPGAHCDPARPIAVILPGERPKADAAADDGPDLEAVAAGIRAAFVIGDRRSYESDPRFGLIALSEIASRALSPAINDPGTAIDVLAALTRILSEGGPGTIEGAAEAQESAEETPPEPAYPHVEVAALADAEVLDAAFMPISRDGAGMIEVAIRLQKALAAVRASNGEGMAAAIDRFSQTALDRGLRTLPFEDDRLRLTAEKAALDLGHQRA